MPPVSSIFPATSMGLPPPVSYYTDGTTVTAFPVSTCPLILPTSPGGNTSWIPSDITTPSAPILQDYWKFDEDTGTTTSDSGLGGTLTSTATLSSSTLWTTSGEMNSGIALTGGTSGSVKVPSFNTDANFTFAAWIKNSSAAFPPPSTLPAPPTPPSHFLLIHPENWSPPARPVRSPVRRP